MGRRKALAFCVLLLWLAGISLAWAQVPVPIVLSPGVGSVSLDERSRWWIDDSGKQTIEQVAANEGLPWATKQPGEQHRIDGKAWWLQFDAQQQAAGRWYLELASSGLDRAQLFYRNASGQWVVQEAGDTRPVSQWPMPGRVPTFELAEEIGKPVRYWLRVEHQRVDFAVPMKVYEQGALLAGREREQFMLGAYFGLAILITLVSVANAAAYRDRAFATYAVYVASLALGQAAYLGVGAQHLWNNALHWNEIATFVLPGLSAAAGLWFVRSVTEPARYSRALDLAVWCLIGALVGVVALDTWLTSRPTFALQMALMSVAMVAVVGLILVVWTHGEDQGIRVIALGFLPVLVMAVFPVMRGLNLIPNSVLTRYGVTLGAMLEMPILFYALNLRISRRRETEVRTAALSHSDALTGLAHTRTLLERLDAAIARARSLRHPCALMAVRIANYDPIVAEFGHEVIDKMLVVAASYLRRAVSDIDLAARVGEHDFAILLEGPTNTATALTRAQQVVASGLRQIDALPAGLTLKFHIAVALLPDQNLDGAGSLKWVLDAVGEIAPGARKMIRPLNF